MTLDYYSMKQELRERPKDFLGAVSLKQLNVFLIGWVGGVYRYGTGLSEPKNFDDREFWKSLRTKYGLPDYTCFNGYTICSMLSGNEEEAFHLYFREWDLFVRDRSPDLLEKVVRDPKRAGTISLPELLKGLFVKPGLYLGEKSLTLLRAYLDGDAYAWKTIRPKERPELDWEEFERWLRTKEKVETPVRWERLLLTFGMNGEPYAFDLFVKEYGLWREEIQQQS